MKKQSLNGAWILDIPGSAFPETKASVPGSVYHDLLQAGLMPDPFYRHNEDDALKIMEYDFVYSRDFSVEKDFRPITKNKSQYSIDTVLAQNSCSHD